MEEVVVDTYALLAMAFGELTPAAEKALYAVYRGKAVGLLPAPVAYEFAVHWLRGRIPGLASLDEAKAFLRAYFRQIDPRVEDYVEAARVKVEGDRELSRAPDPELRHRRLSLVDACVIVVAARRGSPILTGDRDLTYVAEKRGIRVIW